MRRLLAQTTIASMLLVTLGLAGLPGSLNQASAMQTGVPAPGDDGSGGSDPTMAAPIFTAAAPPATVDVKTPYSYAFAATGTPAPTFSLSAGSLPDGLSLTPAGVLAGTPTRGGKFTFTVAAANNAPPQAESPQVIEVFAPGYIEPVADQFATVGVPFSFTPQISGYPTPNLLMQSWGDFPEGYWFASDGTLSGTFTVPGKYDLGYFVYRLDDDGSGNGTVTSYARYTLTVSPAPDAAPILTADAPPATAAAGQPYSYTFAATGTPTPTFSVSSGVPPTGMTLTPEGVLSGTPTEQGSFTFAVAAANSIGSPAVGASHTLVVTAPPVFTSDAPPRATAGRF